MLFRQIAFVLVVSSALIAQNPPAKPQAPPTPQAQQNSSQPDDALAQMRADLNRLESLNLNMSTQIEFLRDQNLQILLRTNVQMWNVLIRDLRGQIEREEQRRGIPPHNGDHGSAPKPDR